jgi:hypothetical protein
MKAKPHIDVRISPTGAITIEAVGYTGSTCEEATRFLEEQLGILGQRQRTRDHYRKDRSVDTRRRRQTPNRQEVQS